MQIFLNRMPAQVKSSLKAYGNEPVKSLRVIRVPINKGVKDALNIISLGSLTINQKRLKYDEIYHLVLYINEHLLLEKNQLVRFRPSTIVDGLKKEAMNVPLSSQNLTITQFLFNAIPSNSGSFWRYDAEHANCQDFITKLLSANHLLTPELNQFINQDAVELLRRIPDISLLTDIAGLGHLAIGGNVP